jgi:glycosyltransferase involved in cell wall biosynthesis
VQVAILSHNAHGCDALGNQVAEKLAFFLDRGADIRVFLESQQRLHPAVRPYCQILAGPELAEDCWEFLSSADLAIVEYGQYYRLLEWLPLLAGGKARLLFDYHGVTPTVFCEGPNREALERGIRHRGLVWCCDAALVHSRFTLQELCGQTAFPSERISDLDYPVDTSRFCPGRPRRHLSAQLGLRDVSLVLFVGRLALNKRLPVLIEALDHLRDRKPPVHVAVVGDMSDVYGVEADRCRQRARELGLTDRVHFLGQVREDELADAYRSANLFVMPSRHEGFCIPVIEAMACGLPVVAARAGALPETVGDAGLTFTVDDPDDLACQVQRVLDCENSGRPLAEQMRRQGLRRAAGHERSLWRDRFGQIAEELLDRPPRQRRDQLKVQPRTPTRAIVVGAESVLVPVRIMNAGTHAVLSEGPGRVQLRSLVVDEGGQRCDLPALDTPVPELLMPGEETSAMIRVPVPARVGSYQVGFFSVASPLCAIDCPHQPDAPARDRPPEPQVPASAFQLLVEPAKDAAEDRYSASSLRMVHRALAEAECKQELPTDYLDVTHGLLAKFKRWLKGKLLGNFKHAYVDVLSRQQSAFNRQILRALQEVAECCTLIEQSRTARHVGGVPHQAEQLVAVTAGDAVELESLLHDVVDQLTETRQRFAALEARLIRLEEGSRMRAGEW